MSQWLWEAWGFGSRFECSKRSHGDPFRGIFIFCIISLIYSIHLIHLGSRASSLENFTNFKPVSNILYRADIVDRNGNFLVKTVSSIDIGISTKKVIDKKTTLVLPGDSKLLKELTQ